jgi:hypothetical protein
VAMGMATAIALFWSNEPSPETPVRYSAGRFPTGTARFHKLELGFTPGPPILPGFYPLYEGFALKKRHWYISRRGSRGTIGVFYTYFSNHARRFRLEKLLYIELSRSSNGLF